MRQVLLLSLLLAPVLTAAAPSAQDLFWRNLLALCGQSYAGRMVEGTEASDAAIGSQRLVMHVRACSDDMIMIPFHVGENRSRTWVITRTPTGLRLKHDHRHEDGSEDRITQYGGDTRSDGSSERQDFHADEFTAKLIPAAAANIWSMLIGPGRTFTYGLHREVEGRRFRVEFDLTRPVATPPAPWGHK